MDGSDKEMEPKDLTAVKSLLSYASEECMDITPVFVSSKALIALQFHPVRLNTSKTIRS